MEVTTIVFLLYFLLAAMMEQVSSGPRVSESCWNNCGDFVGNCSCTSNCFYDGNCCHDYSDYCLSSTQASTFSEAPSQASSGPSIPESCWNNCGNFDGNCSCTSNCIYDGNCCHDYSDYCFSPSQTTSYSVTPTQEFSSVLTTSYESCENNCGNDVGSCTCASYCPYYGNCCPDFNYYCLTTPPNTEPETRTAMTSLSTMITQPQPPPWITSNTTLPPPAPWSTEPDWIGTTPPPPPVWPTSPTPIWTTRGGRTPIDDSCMYNCGNDMGTCSCETSCLDYGNCCFDYYNFCMNTTRPPSPRPTQSTQPVWSTPEVTQPQCGGNLYGAGTFSSPHYPSYYQDNTYCVWYISAPPGQQVFLTIANIQLENCCSCDYIEVHDGPSLASRLLGKVCYNTLMDDFHSTSGYLTVLFRTDYSVVSRGFRADYTSSLPDSAGRVDCSSDNMSIVIQAAYLKAVGYSGHDLYVNDQNCRPTVSSSQVAFSFPLNTCGTRREFNNGRIVYTNGVRAYPTQSGEITRQSHFKLQVLCRMEQDATAQVMFVARETETGNLTGNGTFDINMAFYTSANFYYPVYDSPYVVNLNQYLYVQVKLRRSDSSLVLFLDTCVASPSPHDFQTRSYDLVRNGCKRDSTYYAYSSGSRDVARFRFQAFAFLRSHPAVYLQCKVAICRAQDSNSRCSQGCRMRKARSLRSAADGETATVTLGPIQLRGLKKPAEKLPEEGMVQTEM